MKTSQPTLDPQFTYITEKGGASPGAIMRDNSGDLYLIKLGIPQSSTKHLIKNSQDIQNLAHSMSKKSFLILPKQLVIIITNSPILLLFI